MATSTSTRAPCATCGDKSVGIFKCEGCSQIFCRRHVNEHRDVLSHQLDEIVLEHDTLQQTIAEQNDQGNYRHSLFKQVDQWEKDSITKIRQTADHARQQVDKLTSLKKGEVSNKLHELAERLRKARIDDDYVETDLQRWTTTLEKLKNDMNTVSPLITIHEDSTKLIGKISVTKATQFIEQEERFGESSGDVRIEMNGHKIIHGGQKRSEAFVRGTCEYSLGKHNIRFVVTRESTKYSMSFGIISKLKLIPQSEGDMERSTYGWKSNDEMMSSTAKMPVSKEFRDMRGQKTFEIELSLDCDNRKISYFNQKTKNRREMNVDITVCPFPWQLLFYLYDVGHCVQFVSST